MSEEHNKTDQDIIDAQMEFFRKGKSGCSFAAFAARDPKHFEWHHRVVLPDQYATVQAIVAEAILDDEVSTLALVFPDVDTDEKLDEILPVLNGDFLFLHHCLNTEANCCFRFRARVGDDEAFVSGFGPFDYMPKTRRTPYTSLIFRVSPRPEYDWYLKPPEQGIIHVADMDMKGLADRTLHRMWRSSFLGTNGILGHEPDDESAAKTTFVIPLDRANQILIESLE